MLLFYAMTGDFFRFNPQDQSQTSAPGSGQPAEGNATKSARYAGHSTSGVSKEKDRFSQSFNVLMNYWEIKPAQYESKLHELALKDVRVVSSFVPWAHVETDIYHSLKKFVRTAHSVKLQAQKNLEAQKYLELRNCKSHALLYRLRGLRYY